MKLLLLPAAVQCSATYKFTILLPVLIVAEGVGGSATKVHSSRHHKDYYSDISSSDYFSSAGEEDKEDEDGEEEEGKGSGLSSAEEVDSDWGMSTQASQMR